MQGTRLGRVPHCHEEQAAWWPTLSHTAGSATSIHDTLPAGPRGLILAATHQVPSSPGRLVSTTWK